MVAINENIGIRGNVVVVLTDVRTGAKRTHVSKNIVTDAGDLYYAERGVKTAVPTNFTDGSGNFDAIVELYKGASAAPAKGNDRSDLATLVTGSGKAMSSGYPKVNDADADNSGAGADIITYLAEYLTTEANDTDIVDVCITNPSPGASEVLLQHAEFAAAFDKTANDTLKVFINHSLTGA